MPPIGLPSISGVPETHRASDGSWLRWSLLPRRRRVATHSLSGETELPKQSAGILFFRRTSGGLEVVLVHPGGPFWTRKDLGAWSIPKGEFTEPEDPREAAVREVREETGAEVSGELWPLTPIKQKGGKTVYAWASETDWDTSRLHSNTFQMEFPPRSGQMAEFPEVDRAEWFTIATAREKILPAQQPLLDQLVALLS